MKKPIIITCCIFLLTLLLMGLWRIYLDKEGQPVQIITDMTTAAPQQPRSMPPGTVPFSPEREPASGEDLYLQHCATCHGVNGLADTYVTRHPQMPDAGNLRLSTLPEEETRAIISDGKGAMPAWGKRLSPESIRSVNRHTHTLRQP